MAGKERRRSSRVLPTIALDSDGQVGVQGGYPLSVIAYHEATDLPPSNMCDLINLNLYLNYLYCIFFAVVQ